MLTCDRNDSGEVIGRPYEVFLALSAFVIMSVKVRLGLSNEAPFGVPSCSQLLRTCCCQSLHKSVAYLLTTRHTQRPLLTDTVPGTI